MFLYLFLCIFLYLFLHTFACCPVCTPVGPGCLSLSGVIRSVTAPQHMCSLNTPLGKMCVRVAKNTPVVCPQVSGDAQVRHRSSVALTPVAPVHRCRAASVPKSESAGAVRFETWSCVCRKRVPGAWAPACSRTSSRKTVFAGACAAVREMITLALEAEGFHPAVGCCGSRSLLLRNRPCPWWHNVQPGVRCRDVLRSTCDDQAGAREVGAEPLEAGVIQARAQLHRWVLKKLGH